MQQYLNALAVAYPVLPTLVADGVFGPRTQGAVLAFQRLFGLRADGIIGPITWAAIVERYNLLQAPPPPPLPPPPPTGPAFPGASLRVGSRGENVRLMQQYLNALAGVFPSIPTLVADGIFGPRTQSAVVAFQRLFGLTPDGIIGPITWAAIVTQYNNIQAPHFKVVLDPGHGGTDSGAVNGARLEKNDNLNLALEVRRRLQGQGLDVLMTRTMDVFVPLAERSAFANQNGADIFVSLHRNSSTSAAANGVETFVQNGAGFVPVSYAQDVHGRIVAAGVQNNRGLRQGDFSVLRNTAAPGMLIELGFISNAEDNRLFDQNFDAYASAIALGIAEVLKNPPTPSAAYFNYSVQSGDTLSQIASRFGTTVNAIATLNGLTSTVLFVGQILKIPSGA